MGSSLAKSLKGDSPYINANSLEGKYGVINYNLQGPNRPSSTLVLCFHGLLASLNQFNDIGRNHLMGSNFLVLSFDFWGHGFSASPPSSIKAFDAELFIQQTIELTEALGLTNRPCVVIGFSMGGLIAVEYTLRYPDLVQKVVLLGPAGLCGTKPLAVKFSNTLGPVSRALTKTTGRLLPTLTNNQKIENFYSFPPKVNAPLDAEENEWKFVMRRNLLTITRCAQGLPMWDGLESYRMLSKLTNVDIFFGWGEVDDIVPLRHYEQLLETHFASSYLRVYPGCGHNILVEAMPKIGADILTFLTSRTPAELDKNLLKSLSSLVASTAPSSPPSFVSKPSADAFAAFNNPSASSGLLHHAVVVASHSRTLLTVDQHFELFCRVRPVVLPQCDSSISCGSQDTAAPVDPMASPSSSVPSVSAIQEELASQQLARTHSSSSSSSSSSASESSSYSYPSSESLCSTKKRQNSKQPFSTLPSTPSFRRVVSSEPVSLLDQHKSATTIDRSCSSRSSTAVNNKVSSCHVVVEPTAAAATTTTAAASSSSSTIHKNISLHHQRQAANNKTDDLGTTTTTTTSAQQSNLRPPVLSVTSPRSAAVFSSSDDTISVLSSLTSGTTKTTKLLSLLLCSDQSEDPLVLLSSRSSPNLGAFGPGHIADKESDHSWGAMIPAEGCALPVRRASVAASGSLYLSSFHNSASTESTTCLSSHCACKQNSNSFENNWSNASIVQQQVHRINWACQMAISESEGSWRVD